MASSPRDQGDHLRLDPNNTRHHGIRSQEAIKASLEALGAGRSILVDGDNIVRAGNGTLAAARALGLRVKIVDTDPETLIAVRRPDLTGAQAVQAGILDNRTQELSAWDTGELAALVQNDLDFYGRFWNDAEMDRLLALTVDAPSAPDAPAVSWAPPRDATGRPGPTSDGPASSGRDAWNPTPPGPSLPAGITEAALDEADEAQDEPAPLTPDIAATYNERWQVRPGDLWEIPARTLDGRCHYVLCGDARDPYTFARLFGGRAVLLMTTDPPYGVSYDVDWRIEAGVNSPSSQYGAKIANDDIVDWSSVYALWKPQVLYAWHAGLYAADVARSLQSADYELRSQIMWAKPHLILSRGHYHWQHEPCWYAVRKGATANWQGDRKQTTVWTARSRTGGTKAVEDEADAFVAGHASQKPVKLYRIPILNHTVVGDVVADPFVGSGTAVVACEQLGRLCYAVDIDPRFVAATLQRMAEQGCVGRRVERDA